MNAGARVSRRSGHRDEQREHYREEKCRVDAQDAGREKPRHRFALNRMTQHEPGYCEEERHPESETIVDDVVNERRRG
jgi:hypothetical protein